ncbi:CaiB/BaiF CoA-transferase family protein [uncultured Phascolarctobacterium sp.]|uniref:CaiB/BaiF CoA transferase family protein n=1 Tax=uncultured Phascolarctobacterium sp. TaxID=512296 RepID=UPI0025EA4C35|nr:CoA transferase [uncultured Phascolarctobacterium sp.]
MNGKGILDGVRVLGIEQQVAAPYCTMMLADQGAEVIKVERAGSGDSAREMAPILKNGENTTSGYFMRFNRNKKSVTVDFSKPEGIEILKGLIAKSDIIVENFKPGMMEKFKLGYDVIREINPKGVYVAISGFGRLPKKQGPFAKRTAYDIVAQAMGGLMHLAGQVDGPPTWLGVAIGDVGTGVFAANAALLGYIKALKTGQGEFIDVAMYDCMIALAERAHNVYSFTGKILSRGPDPLICPWGPFEAKDGYVALIVPTQAMWVKFCKAIKREDLINEELDSGPKRAAKINMLMPIIKEWMADKTKNEVCEILMAEGLPCGPVQNSQDVFNCPHVKAREMFVTIPDTVMGEVTVVGSPYKLDGEEPIYGAVPQLGADNDEILSQLLKYDENKIAELKTKKVI